MLIVIGIIVAVSFLGKASKAAIPAPPSSGPQGEYSETGNAASLTKNKFTQRAPLFTPSNQSVASQFTIPFQLVGDGSADPALTAMRATFKSSKPPMAGIANILGIQNWLTGGYK